MWGEIENCLVYLTYSVVFVPSYNLLTMIVKEKVTDKVIKFAAF